VRALLTMSAPTMGGFSLDEVEEGATRRGLPKQCVAPTANAAITCSRIAYPCSCSSPTRARRFVVDGTQWILGVGGTVLFLVWAIAVPHAVMTAREKEAEKREEKADKAESAPAPVAHAAAAAVRAVPAEMQPVPAVLRRDPLWRPAPAQPGFRSVPRELVDFPRKAGARASGLSKAQWLGPLSALQEERLQTLSVRVQRADTAPFVSIQPLVVTTSAATGPHPGQHDGFDPMPPWESEITAIAANSKDERNPFAPI